VQRDPTPIESLEGPNDRLPQLQRLRPNLMIRHKNTKAQRSNQLSSHMLMNIM
jgi:hypothetical protein